MPTVNETPAIGGTVSSAFFPGETHALGAGGHVMHTERCLLVDDAVSFTLSTTIPPRSIVKWCELKAASDFNLPDGATTATIDGLAVLRASTDASIDTNLSTLLVAHNNTNSNTSTIVSPFDHGQSTVASWNQENYANTTTSSIQLRLIPTDKEHATIWYETAGAVFSGTANIDFRMFTEQLPGIEDAS